MGRIKISWNNLVNARKVSIVTPYALECYLPEIFYRSLDNTQTHKHTFKLHEQFVLEGGLTSKRNRFPTTTTHFVGFWKLYSRSNWSKYFNNSNFKSIRDRKKTHTQTFTYGYGNVKRVYVPIELNVWMSLVRLFFFRLGGNGRRDKNGNEQRKKHPYFQISTIQIIMLGFELHIQI